MQSRIIITKRKHVAPAIGVPFLNIYVTLGHLEKHLPGFYTEWLPIKRLQMCRCNSCRVYFEHIVKNTHDVNEMLFEMLFMLTSRFLKNGEKKEQNKKENDFPIIL
jgi:hypothetical protein